MVQLVPLPFFVVLIFFTHYEASKISRFIPKAELLNRGVFIGCLALCTLFNY